MKTNKVGTLHNWAAIVLLSLSTALPATLAAQDADAKEDKEKAKIQREQEREKARQEREAERVYQQAKKLADKGQWEEALKAFDEASQKGGVRADGALYWKAYAQNKLNQQAEALSTLAELKKSFPDSSWMKVARELEAEIRRAGRQQSDDPGSQTDEELKLLAINSLLHTDPEKALPILMKLLEGNASPRIKEKALFVLSQSGSDKAREIVASFARGKSNPELQLKSLEYLALFGGKESRQVLADVYASTSEKKIKKAILGFFMIGGERDRLLAAAKGEKDADLRGEAIGQLGVLRARAELFEMYQAESEVKVKKKILDALFVGGAADKISDLAQNEKDAVLRRAAIEKLGLMEGTTATLLKMYANEKEKEIRKKVIEALFLQGDAKAIVDIARKETDPELKKKAIEQLSIMNSKEGSEYFEEILNK